MRWRGWTGAAALALSLAIAGCGSVDMVNADQQPGQEHITQPDAGAPTSTPGTGGSAAAPPPPATGGTTGAAGPMGDNGDDSEKPGPGKGDGGMKGPKS